MTATTQNIPMTLAICLRAAVKTLRSFETHTPHHSGFDEHKNATDSVATIADELDAFAKSQLNQVTEPSSSVSPAVLRPGDSENTSHSGAKPRSRRRRKA